MTGFEFVGHANRGNTVCASVRQCEILFYTYGCSFAVAAQRKVTFFGTQYRVGNQGHYLANIVQMVLVDDDCIALIVLCTAL